MARGVLIVDDHAGFRTSARAVLEAAGHQVVGEAGGARAAVDAAERLRPGLVLLDVQLPDGDGFDVASALAGLPEPPVVVLVSVRDRASYRRRLPGSPARGFIPKDRLTPAAVAALLA